jgi:hypothetical protein
MLDTKNVTNLVGNIIKNTIFSMGVDTNSSPISGQFKDVQRNLLVDIDKDDLDNLMSLAVRQYSETEGEIMEKFLRFDRNVAAVKGYIPRQKVIESFCVLLIYNRIREEICSAVMSNTIHDVHVPIELPRSAECVQFNLVLAETGN